MLTIDNGERTAPAAFNDSDLLEISRKIEREEGSTYRVNGKEVRARDVQILFADAPLACSGPPGPDQRDHFRQAPGRRRIWKMPPASRAPAPPARRSCASRRPRTTWFASRT